MKMLKKIFLIVMVMLGVAGTVMAPGLVHAVDPQPSSGTQTTGSKQCPNGEGFYNNSPAECGIIEISDGKESDLMGTVKTVINVVLSVVGVIAVAVIILGGISFITSQGDTSKVTKARNTILYGVVGLVVALLAFAIVNFVLKNVFKSS